MRGRPKKSPIRRNIISILSIVPKATGYDIYKIYKTVFPKCTLRSIYYHLHKGVTLHEFVLESVMHESGDYSWGRETQKMYYTIGKNARVEPIDTQEKEAIILQATHLGLI